MSVINATEIPLITATANGIDVNSCDCVMDRQLQQRKIRPTRRSVSGIYAFRGETPIQFESTLERDFLIRCEFFLHVLDIVPQPVRIPFEAGGRVHHYTPDFLVYYRLGNRMPGDYPKPMLVEVKPSGDWRANWRKWLPKWKAARRHARDAGWSFRICDESRIRDQTFDNIRFLERYKRMSFPAEESEWVLATVRKMGSAPFHYILASHFNGIYKAEGVAHIWHLLSMRKLDCDMGHPLGDNTEFWMPTDE